MLTFKQLTPGDVFVFTFETHKAYQYQGHYIIGGDGCAIYRRCVLDMSFCTSTYDGSADIADDCEVERIPLLGYVAK